MCVHAELRAACLGSTSIILHLFPVHQLETHHGYGLNSKLLGSTCLWPRCWDNKFMELCPGFYVDIGDSNSGPHGSISSAVTCEPSSKSPPPVNVFLFLSVYSLSPHLSYNFQGDRDPIFHGYHRRTNFSTMIDTYQAVDKQTGGLHSIWKLSNRKCQGLTSQNSCFWILSVMAHQGVAPRTLLITWMEPSWCN